MMLLAFIRSLKLDITNDEAYSFKLVHELPSHFASARNQLYGTANTHWLNSFFIWIENSLVGTAPWMFRLHSVLALSLFMYGLYQLFKEEKTIFLLVPFLFLLTNHYLFDFFSLARGYALEMAFELMTFLALIRHKKPSTIYFWLLLSCLANYTNLYFLFAYLIVDWIQESHKNKNFISINKDFLLYRRMLIPFFLWTVPNLYFIKYVTKDLEEGRRNNFITDTLVVFLERSYEGMNHVFYVATATILLLLVFIFYLVKRNTVSEAWKTLFAVFLVMIILIHFFYFFLNSPYPYGRTSLGFWVLFLLLISYACIQVLKKWNPIFRTSFIFILLILNTYFLLTRVNMRSTVEWFKQQGMAEWVHDVQQHHPKNIKNIRVAMSIDHYGVYNNYYQYLHPEDVPARLLVYDRKSYDQIPDSIRAQFPQQDEFLLYGDYHSFLDSIFPFPKPQWIKTYPDMRTDWYKQVYPSSR